jgi:hypothetical protein
MSDRNKTPKTETKTEERDRAKRFGRRVPLALSKAKQAKVKRQATAFLRKAKSAMPNRYSASEFNAGREDMDALDFAFDVDRFLNAAQRIEHAISESCYSPEHGMKYDIADAVANGEYATLGLGRTLRKFDLVPMSSLRTMIRAQLQSFHDQIQHELNGAIAHLRQIAGERTEKEIYDVRNPEATDADFAFHHVAAARALLEKLDFAKQDAEHEKDTVEMLDRAVDR